MSVGRITNLMLSQHMLDNINSAQSEMDTTQEELSSGKTINEPSDNPYGATLAVSLQGQLSQLTNYSSNVTDGQSWTTQGLSALNNITNQTQRAEELVTAALNGTQSPDDLTYEGDEINQLIAGIKSDANTQYDGQYVFAGSQTTTQPWSTSATDDAYSGDTNAVSRTVSQGASVQVNSPLYTVLNGTATGNTGLLSQLRSIAAKLANGTAPSASDLDDLQGSESALRVQSTTLGAASQRLTMAATRIQTLQTSATTSLSNDEDANYAQVATDFSNQQAAFTAALKAGASIVQTSLMDFLSD